MPVTRGDLEGLLETFFEYDKLIEAKDIVPEQRTSRNLKKINLKIRKGK